MILGSVLLTAYLLVIQHYCDWTQMAYPWAVKLGLVLGVVAGAAVLTSVRWRFAAIVYLT